MSISAALPAFKLPAVLRSEGYALRSETDDDIPFLLALFASTRAAELALAIDWSAQQKQNFLESQFKAQRHHYKNYIDGCAFNVIEQHGAPIGRLYLQQRQTNLHIVDISLLPDYCGKGLGTAILEALMAEARARGRGVGIMVEKFNPAMRLYRRLGFTEVADSEVYLEMEAHDPEKWEPVFGQDHAQK